MKIIKFFYFYIKYVLKISIEKENYAECLFVIKFNSFSFYKKEIEINYS